MMDAAADAAVAPAATPRAAGDAPRAAPRGARTLTYSAMEAWGRCETEYRLAFEELIVPVEYPAALAIGSGFHAGVEALHRGRSLADAWAIAAQKIEAFAAKACLHLDEEGKGELAAALARDAAKTRAMLRAWLERHDTQPPTGAPAGEVRFLDRDLEVVETELALEAPLVNPLTGRPSRTFILAGRVDAVVRHRDGDRRFSRADGTEGWHICEIKTTGEDLDEFIEAMRFSSQPAIYQALAGARLARDFGPCLGTVLDIARKPTIRPKKGEAPEAFEARALDEYRKEPDRYFRRVVLPVDEALRREAMVNAWRIADGIRRAERFGYVSKRGPACRGAFGPCRYRPLCWSNDRTGFVRKQTAHEELADQE
jgi:hypothetical protein